MKNFLDPDKDPPSKIYKAKGKNIEALPGYMAVTVIVLNDNQIDEDTLTFNNVGRMFITIKNKKQVVNLWSNHAPFLIWVRLFLTF